LFFEARSLRYLAFSEAGSLRYQGLS
jgi:hypothetical protein